MCTAFACTESSVQSFVIFVCGGNFVRTHRRTNGRSIRKVCGTGPRTAQGRMFVMIIMFVMLILLWDVEGRSLGSLSTLLPPHGSTIIHCHSQMGNFEGMAAVASVFGNAAIQRIKPLWKRLSRRVLHITLHHFVLLLMFLIQ